MGAFWNVIQAELDRERFDVSDRKIALRLGVAPTTVSNWRQGLKRLPEERNLRAVADFTGRSYEDILLLALSETGHARGTRLADGRFPDKVSEPDESLDPAALDVDKDPNVEEESGESEHDEG